MGNMFYIVIAIAVIQAIVGGLAKAKEKRKKSELNASLRGVQAKKAAGSPGPQKNRSLALFIFIDFVCCKAEQ